MLKKKENKCSNYISVENNTFLFSVFLIAYVFFIGYYIQTSVGGIGWDYYSYKSVAIKYSDGYFKEALNAYWSPLVSWLMIPFVKWSLFRYKEIMVINFLSGIIFLLLPFTVANQYGLKGMSKILFLISFFIYAVCIQINYYKTPDFLSLVFFITYIIVITSPEMKTNFKYYLLGGFAALLCAFGKIFYIYFVVISLLFFIGYLFLFKREKEFLRIKNLVKVFLIAITGIAIWVALLSWKYERFIISSSGTYNMTVISPQGQQDHFGIKEGLYPPPDLHSYHYFVDPTYYPIKKRETFSDAESFQYQLRVLKYNLGILYYSFSYFSYFKIGVLIFIVAAFILLRDSYSLRERLMIYFASAILVMAGYVWVLIEERYLLGSQLLLFMGAFFTVQGCENRINVKWISNCLLFVVVFAFMKTNYTSMNDWVGRNDLAMSRTITYENKIADLPFLKNKKIATAYSHNEIDDLICFEICNANKCQNLGNVGKFFSTKEQYEQLKRYDIDYYLYYGCSSVDDNNNCTSKEVPYYIKDKEPLYTDRDYGVSVYSMKPY